MSEERPSVGRIVHYVQAREKDEPRCRAAIITDVVSGHNVDLTVFHPHLEVRRTVSYADPSENRPATWHWPERV